MIKSVLRLLPVLLLGISACSSDGIAGPKNLPHYESIAGSYSGAMVGLTQGIGFSSIFSMSVSQTEGATTGSWGISGELNDGVYTVQIIGTGTLTGSVGTGNNPSVNLTIKTGGCPNYNAQFSGAYDSANRRITITGPVDILNDDCSVFLRYPMTIILNR